MEREQLQQEIGERFKYLFINQFQGDFDVLSFSCEIIEMNDQNRILEYEISMKIDALAASGDGNPRDWYILMRDTDEKIVNFFYEYGYDNDSGRIRRGNDIDEKYRVEEGFFVECELKWDEKHNFDIIYKITYG